MRRIAIKLVELVVVVFLVTCVTFLLLHLLPGSPAESILGAEATPKLVAELNKALGLNKPLPVQYVHWINQLLHGNFGKSYVNDEPVGQSILQHLPVTLELLIVSQLMAF